MVLRDWQRRLRRLAPQMSKRGIQRLLYGYADFYPSFSLAGEDMIVRHLLGLSAIDGFYVDVGAHHPTAGSNTCHFRWLGWKGINIEPQPDLIARFVAECPNDINLGLAIGTTPGQSTLFIPDWGPGGGSLYKSKASRAGIPLRTIEIEVQPLATVLDVHLPANRTIDFLSIDVEGAEMEVMKSNDWERYRPRILCIETTMESDRSVTEFLASLDYKVAATNSIFIDEIFEIFAIDARLNWRDLHSQPISQRTHRQVNKAL